MNLTQSKIFESIAQIVRWAITGAFLVIIALPTIVTFNNTI
jgi:hypothetical protein